MHLKDHLKDTYQKASLEKNNLVLENVINRWIHRFGIETINELVVKDQEQINLIKKDQGEENQGQFNFALLENVQHQKEKDLEPKKEKIINNTEIINKDIYKSYENKYIQTEELPLPNINNLRKWIKNEKKAS